MRGRAAVATVSPDDLVAAREGDVLELTRGQETELPQALKWQVARADEDYDAALVEARRITVDTTRIASESFPMAVPPEEAERRCRRAADGSLDRPRECPCSVCRRRGWRSIPPTSCRSPMTAVPSLCGSSPPADADARGVEAVRQDRDAYDLPPGAPRPSALSQAVVFGAPEAVLLDLPQLTEDQPAHRPFAAAHAVPWPGEIAVFRSPSTDGFELLTSFGTRGPGSASWPRTFYAGGRRRASISATSWWSIFCPARWKASRTLTLFRRGQCARHRERAGGIWEIVQAGAAELAWRPVATA